MVEFLFTRLLCAGTDNLSFKHISFVTLNSHCQKSWRSNQKIVFSFKSYVSHYIQQHMKSKLNNPTATIIKQVKGKNKNVHPFYIIQDLYTSYIFHFKNFLLHVFYSQQNTSSTKSVPIISIFNVDCFLALSKCLESLFNQISKKNSSTF